MRPFHAGRLPAAIAWRFTYLVLQGGLSLTLFAILAHVLPKPQFAAAAVAQGVLVIAQAVGDFGLSQSAVTVLPAQIAADPEAEGALLRGAATLYAVAALAALAVTLLAVLVVPQAAKAPVALIAPAGAVTVLVSGADGLLRSQGEFRRPAVIVTISRLGAFAGVAAAVADGSATATCAAIAAGTFVASVPAARVLLDCFRSAARGRARELRRAANALGLGELCMIAGGRLDTVLMSAVAGTIAGAGFESTWRVYQLAQYVVGGLATASAPFIASAYGSGRHDRALALMRRVGAVVLASGLVLGAGLVVLGGPISRLLFGGVGPAVASALPPLALLTPLSFMGFFAMIMLATSPEDRWAILPANALGAGVNIALLLAITHHGQLEHGTLACAIGLSVGSLAMIARLLLFARRLRNEPASGPASATDLNSLRILVLSGRFPEAGGRGDQIRALLNTSYLASKHRVAVLATEPASSEQVAQTLDELAEVHVVSASKLARALSALRAVCSGQPAQTGWMMPARTWREARRLAAGADVVLVITSRSLRGRLPAPIVLDHIDALSHNMAERAKGHEALPIRLFAALEGQLMAAWERRLATFVSAQLGTSSDVARMLPKPPEVGVIPIGWSGEVFEPTTGAERDIDVIFTGNMDYPPNRDGAEWLRREILPRVRERRPQTTAWIVGRAADRVAGLDVQYASNVPDMLSYLRRARVAVAPVFGAGSPLKTLEAAACGAAVVSTPWGLECYELPGAVATDTDGFVEAIVRLLDDEAARLRQSGELQRALEALSDIRLGAKLERIIRDAASAPEPAAAPA